MTDPQPTLLAWARTDRNGAALVTVAPEYREVHGHEVVIDAPAHSFSFSLLLDPNGQTRHACMVVANETGRRTRELRRADATRWLVDDRPAPHLDGCTELDIAATPYTNTLAIRQLSQAGSRAGWLDVAWVDLDLKIRPVRQHYTRLEGTGADGAVRYQYRTDHSPRTWTLTVDDRDHVIHYEGFARRTSPTRTR